MGFANENDQPYPCPDCCESVETGTIDCLDCSDGTLFERYQLVITGHSACSGVLSGTWIVNRECGEATGGAIGNCCRVHVLDPPLACGIFGEVIYLMMWVDSIRSVGARFIRTGFLGIGVLFRKYYTADPIDETENGNGSCDFQGITLTPNGSGDETGAICRITRI